MALNQAILSVLIKAQNKAGGAFNSVIKQAKSLKGVLAQLGATAFLTDTVKTAGDFETSIRKVVVAAGNAVDRFDDIKAAAAEAGATTAFSATDAAKALEILIKTGFSVDEAIGTLPTTLNFATANSLDLADAVEFAAKTMNNMGLNTGDTNEKIFQFNRVGNVLTKNVNAAAQSMPELARAFSQTGASADQLGLGLEETASIISFLAKQGLNLEQRSTGLKNLLAQIANSASPAQKALREAGIATTDFYEVLDELRALGAEATPVIAAFGLEAGPALQKLVKAGTAGLRDFQTEVKTTGNELEEARGIMSGGFKGAVDGLNSSWEALKITFGEEFLTDIVNGIRSLTDKVRELAAGGDLDIIKDGFKTILFVLSQIADAASIAFNAINVGYNGVKATLASLIGATEAADKAFAQMEKSGKQFGEEVSKKWDQVTGAIGEHNEAVEEAGKLNTKLTNDTKKDSAEQTKSLAERAKKQRELTATQQEYLDKIEELKKDVAVYSAIEKDTERAGFAQQELNRVTGEYKEFLEENRTLVKNTFKDQEDATKAVAEALNALGVTSEEIAAKQIKAGQAQFELLKQQSTLVREDGIVSIRELESAWLEMAKTSLEASKNAEEGLRKSTVTTLQQQAEVLGLSDADDMLKSEVVNASQSHKA